VTRVARDASVLAEPCQATAPTWKEERFTM